MSSTKLVGVVSTKLVGVVNLCLASWSDDRRGVDGV